DRARGVGPHEVHAGDVELGERLDQLPSAAGAGELHRGTGVEREVQPGPRERQGLARARSEHAVHHGSVMGLSDLEHLGRAALYADLLAVYDDGPPLAAVLVLRRAAVLALADPLH